ncbi:MAG: hypothetical protein ACTSX6_06470 [Candidatus Heimdallarchaeaceae archaeon]
MVNHITRFQPKRNKGLALTVSAVLTGLFFVGAAAFLYWFILSHFLTIRTVVSQAETERHAMNLANVLISSEKLAYVKDGKIYRGVLDSRKLDSFFTKKGGTQDVGSSEYIDALLTDVKEIDLGYPNTFNLVNIIDLSSCDQEGNCAVWSTSLLGPITVERSKVMNFLDCLKQSFDNDVTGWVRRSAGCGIGAVIGGVIGGPLGAAIGCGVGFVTMLWNWNDIMMCATNNLPESVKAFFVSGSPISYEGLPVVILYPDGTTHAGRIQVGVLEWG